MSKISSVIRTMFFVALVVALVFMCGLRLLQTQVVDGEMYLAMTKKTVTAEQPVEATRGVIADTKGVALNGNKIAFTVSFQESMLVKGTENDIIYRVLKVLEKNGEEWNESLPISRTAPYKFKYGADAAVSKLRKTLSLAEYATADDCIFWLYETYKIEDKYDEKMRRLIAGVRYEMTIKDFSDKNAFVLAADISESTVGELKELSNYLPGVDITESWERVYLSGDVGSHYRGTVGAISAEDYLKLKDKGYTLNDVIGLSGVELALESELRGTRGVRAITRGSDGALISDEIEVEPQAGHSVMLTIDSGFQSLVQQALENHIKYLNSPYYTTFYDSSWDGQPRGKGCQTGGVVVLDVKTGGVLAMASYPNYDLNEYVENYAAVLNREYAPVFNRALSGVFRPGSTFKTITTTAGLMEGAITESSLITCNHVYTYYPGFRPECLGWHGSIDLRYALRKSCNVYFYETARRVGIDKLAAWAKRFGIGEDLGFDLTMNNGQMSSLELFAEKGYTWNNGDIVQAGIGQCETMVTPMHLAVQAMTIANNGVRYEPHIVKSVYNYDFTEKLYDKETVVADDFSNEPGMKECMRAIRDGMKLVAQYENPFQVAEQPGWDWHQIFDYVGAGVENVAIKTGTSQTGGDGSDGLYPYNSCLIGFYPAEDPEIAFGIILEHGEFARVLSGNIIRAYSQGNIMTNWDEEGVPKTIM